MKPRPPAPESALGLGSVVRDGGVLALAGGSLGLAIVQVVGQWTEGFARSNVLPRGARGVMLAVLAAGVCAGAAVAMVLAMLGASSPSVPATKLRVPALSRVARLAAPFMLSAFVPGLLTPGAWTDPVKLGVFMAGFVLLFERLCRLHFEAYGEGAGPEALHWASPALRAQRWMAERLRRVPGRLGARLAAAVPLPRVATLVVLLAAAGYIAYTSFFALRNHARFETYTWDLGQLDNQFYNLLHGHPFRCPVLIREGNWSELRNHAEAVMFFLLPIYALHPAATTLLVLQSVLLGLGGVWLYRFAARRLTRLTAVVLALCYYLYPPLHGAQFFDIHFQPIAAAFLLMAIDAFDGRHMKAFVVCLALAILCREDISVGTAVFGLFLVVTRHRPRVGLIVFAVSVAYFVLLRFVIMPAVGQWGFAEHYDQLLPQGERSFGGIVKTILTNPTFTFTTLLTEEKLRYALQILLPLAFLPLRRIHLALSVLPGAYFTLLTDYGPTHDIGYQYSGYFIPYVFPAAALALEQLGKGGGLAGVARRRAAVAAMVAGTIITTTHWGAIPPRKKFHVAYGNMSFEPPTQAHRDKQRYLDELMRLVPKDAILGVTDRELPHVSNRIETWNMSTGYKGIDYILYNTDNPISTEREQYDAALRDGYTVAAQRPGLILIKRPGL